MIDTSLVILYIAAIILGAIFYYFYRKRKRKQPLKPFASAKPFVDPLISLESAPRAKIKEESPIISFRDAEYPEKSDSESIGIEDTKADESTQSECQIDSTGKILEKLCDINETLKQITLKLDNPSSGSGIPEKPKRKRMRTKKATEDNGK